MREKVNWKRIVGNSGVAYTTASEARVPATTKSRVPEPADVEAGVLGKRSIDPGGKNQVVESGIDKSFVKARIGEVHVETGVLEISVKAGVGKAFVESGVEKRIGESGVCKTTSAERTPACEKTL